MKYENINKVAVIIEEVTKIEKIINSAKAIQNSINSDVAIELRAHSVGCSISVPLTNTQLKSIIDIIIEDNTKQLNKYKEELKDL